MNTALTHAKTLARRRWPNQDLSATFASLDLMDDAQLADTISIWQDRMISDSPALWANAIAQQTP